MSKGVLIHNPSSRYDDNPASHYHFPKQYLGRIEKLLGDWVLFYESRKNRGAMAYRAMARMITVRDDPVRSDHFYADMEQGSYIQFAQDVPLRNGDGTLVNKYLDAGNGRVSSGRAISAVQPIDDGDFWRIVARGLETGELPREDSLPEMKESAEPFIMDGPRDRVTITREVRDRAFCFYVEAYPAAAR